MTMLHSLKRMAMLLGKRLPSKTTGIGVLGVCLTTKKVFLAHQGVF
jgi:hypothetical protein